MCPLVVLCSLPSSRLDSHRGSPDHSTGGIGATHRNQPRGTLGASIGLRPKAMITSTARGSCYDADMRASVVLPLIITAVITVVGCEGGGKKCTVAEDCAGEQACWCDYVFGHQLTETDVNTFFAVSDDPRRSNMKCLNREYLLSGRCMSRESAREEASKLAANGRCENSSGTLWMYGWQSTSGPTGPGLRAINWRVKIVSC